MVMLFKSVLFKSVLFMNYSATTLAVQIVMIFWICSAFLLAAVALFFRQRYSRFRQYGVNHLTPLAPLGNLYRSTLQFEHLTKTIQRGYNAFPNDRFIGHYEFTNKMVLVRDLDLIRKITLKDFDHFAEHRKFISADNDPLFGRNIVSLTGSEWKDMRSTLSPAFTISKVRLMVPFMTEVGNQLNNLLKEKINKSGDGYLDFETRDLTTKYAIDVFTSCAFGLKNNSQADEKNEFFVIGHEATNFTFVVLLKFIGFSTCPMIMNFLKFSLFTNNVKSFFRKTVSSVMRNRTENHIIRPDMMQLLMEAKKGSPLHEEKTADKDEDAGLTTVEESAVGHRKVTRDWSDDDLISQAMIFFLAGFTSASTSLTFLLHELALNPEIQDRLVKEIREVDAKHGGKFDYNAIQQMQYMDMVVSESLRLWPPIAALDRVCCKDYNLGKSNIKNDKDYIIRKGENISVPVYSIHRNPEYFPDPDKFDPERFSEENKHNIKPFSYSPFGQGPRNCIASRFALCEVKVMMYQLLRDLEVSPATRTCIPLELSAKSISLRIKGGHWLRFKVRP